MKITSSDIKHIAHLSNLTVTNNEIDLFARQLNEVLKHVENIKNVKLPVDQPLLSVNDQTNIFRKDDIKDSLKIGEYFSAPVVINKYDE